MRTTTCFHSVAAAIAIYIGLFASGVLITGHLLNLPVPCGGSHGCQAVAMHPSSKLAGVPIAYIGFAAYLVLLALLPRLPKSLELRRLFFVLTLFGFLASASLLIYSQTVIQATCGWCIASGVAMATLLVVGGLMLSTRHRLQPVPPRLLLPLGVLTSIALGSQAGAMHREATRPPVQAERLAGLSDEHLIDPKKTLGSPDAPLTVIMFSDLWCPVCRTAHAALSDFQRRHPDRVRLAYRHRPLSEIRGHETSGAAAALSEIAAEQGKFWPFIDALYRAPRQFSREQYRELLQRLEIDADQAEQRIARADDEVVQRVWSDQFFAEHLGIHATPTFIVLAPGRPPVSSSLKALPDVMNRALRALPQAN
jgi:protein-disulfide isomerase